MRAAQISGTLPCVRLDDPASRVAQAAGHDPPGVAVLDEHGHVIAVLPLVAILRLALPAYLHDEPCLARACTDRYTAHLSDRLATTQVRDVLPEAPYAAPTTRHQATVTEIAEKMARHRSPLAVVRQGTDEPGIITASHLLRHIAG